MEETTLAAQQPAAEPAAPEVPAPEAVLAQDAPDTAALLAELQQYRAQAAADAQDKALLADPDRGAVYGQLRQDVQQLLAYCANSGTPVTPEAAFAVALYDQLPTLRTAAADTARRSAMQAISANAAASPGPLGASAAPAAPDFETMSSEEFAKYHYRAVHGEWK